MLAIPSIFWQVTLLHGTAGLSTDVARSANLSATSTCPCATVANCPARQASQHWVQGQAGLTR